MNETIYGIWNTVIGNDSSRATDGTSDVWKYNSDEIRESAFDRNDSTKYTS